MTEEVQKEPTWDDFRKTKSYAEGVGFWKDLRDEVEKVSGQRSLFYDNAKFSLWTAIGLNRITCADLIKRVETLENEVKTLKSKNEAKAQDYTKRIAELENSVKILKSKYRKSVLTPIQIKVLYLMQEGRNTHDIAAELKVKDSRISNIKKRLKQMDLIKDGTGCQKTNQVANGQSA